MTHHVGEYGSLAMQNPQTLGNVLGGYHGFNDIPTVPCAHAVSPLHGGYDWDSEENKMKWRGIFSKGTPEKPLKKVLTKALLQIHQSPHTSNLPGEISQMTAVDEAWDYVESLLIKLLAMLTARPLPTSKLDVERRVNQTFPSPIGMKTKDYTEKVLKHRKKPELALPVNEVHSLLKTEVLQNSKLDIEVSQYLTAILEYISMEILKLAVHYVIKIPSRSIAKQDIKAAISIDKGHMLLMDMFESDMHFPNEKPIHDSDKKRRDQTYEEVVKDIITDEKQYLRELQMITKVFGDAVLMKSNASKVELNAIFSNVNDITELTMQVITLLEDTIEMKEEDNEPAVGSCFEDLAEAMEFDVYVNYAKDILSSKFKNTLDVLLSRSDVSESCRSAGAGYKIAVKYYLPMLLKGPIYHCFHYRKYIENLMEVTSSDDERNTLKQVLGMFKEQINPLNKLIATIIQKPGHFVSSKSAAGDIFHSLEPNRTSLQESQQKLRETQKLITNWENPLITTTCSKLIYDGNLKVLKGRGGGAFHERHVFLFDAMIVITKPHKGTAGNFNHLYSYKSSHLIKNVEVHDREDLSNGVHSNVGSGRHDSVSSTSSLVSSGVSLVGGNSVTAPAISGLLSSSTNDGDFSHTFELKEAKESIIFKAESVEDKNSWMAALVMLNSKTMLEKALDVTLAEEDGKHPLRFPPVHKYQFAEPNSGQNIVFEDKEKGGGVPDMIKGATLVKLVERLTYHLHADPMFMKTFLTTYRSFSTPREFLDLLIKRFNIPDPEFSSDSESDSDIVDKTSRVRQALDMKRFRTEYSQPVQFRVVNVLKHWVDQHFYDFQNDTELLTKLNEFLTKIQCRNMRKWVEVIKMNVDRKIGNDEYNKTILFDFDKSPPEIEHHLEDKKELILKEEWPELLTYHPIEFARQLTLLDFQYYRAVKPSELVDLAWMGKEKNEKSPNLMRMIRNTTNFTNYLKKLIVETENIEERIAVVNRMLEIMLVLKEQNNFNGMLAISACMESSSIHRLIATKDGIRRELKNAMEEANSLVVDKHAALYWKRLREINPPCVPFFGTHLNIINFLETGNKDFLPCCPKSKEKGGNNDADKGKDCCDNQQLINFTKRRKVAEIISEIQQYQNQPYNNKTYEPLKNFLENLDPFPDMSTNNTNEPIEKYLFDRSLEIEPKNSKPKDSERKWKNLKLQSPGIKPSHLRGKSNPPPRLRHHRTDGHSSHGIHPDASGDNSDSPISPPIPSNPSTPGLNTPGTATTTCSNTSNYNEPPTHDWVELPINVSNPPPLPPKPGIMQMPITVRPPSPPPPLPPRRDQAPMGGRSTFGNHSTPIKSPALESRSPLMDPVDSTQGRHGRVAHHSSVMNSNDHIGNAITNHGQHGHSANANSIRSPVNPPVPKRNYPTSYTGQFSSGNAGSSTLGTQGPPPLSIRDNLDGESPSSSPLWHLNQSVSNMNISSSSNGTQNSPCTKSATSPQLPNPNSHQQRHHSITSPTSISHSYNSITNSDLNHQQNASMTCRGNTNAAVKLTSPMHQPHVGSHHRADHFTFSPNHISAESIQYGGQGSTTHYPYNETFCPAPSMTSPPCIMPVKIESPVHSSKQQLTSTHVQKTSQSRPPQNQFTTYSTNSPMKHSSMAASRENK